MQEHPADGARAVSSSPLATNMGGTMRRHPRGSRLGGQFCPDPNAAMPAAGSVMSPERPGAGAVAPIADALMGAPPGHERPSRLDRGMRATMEELPPLALDLIASSPEWTPPWKPARRDKQHVAGSDISGMLFDLVGMPDDWPRPPSGHHYSREWRATVEVLESQGAVEFVRYAHVNGIWGMPLADAIRSHGRGTQWAGVVYTTWGKTWGGSRAERGGQLSRAASWDGIEMHIAGRQPSGIRKSDTTQGWAVSSLYIVKDRELCRQAFEEI